jgi:hypothetical protein
MIAGLLLSNTGCYTFMAATGLDQGRSGTTLNSVGLPGDIFLSVGAGAAFYQDSEDPEEEFTGGMIGLLASPLLLFLDRTIVVWLFDYQVKEE